jgi:hypothetical protein
VRADDRRTTLCRKWRNVAGKRTPCTFDRDHSGPCSWVMTPEIDPDRGPGPYPDVPTALRQYADWVDLMPPGTNMTQGAVQIVREALAASNVTPTRFEVSYLEAHTVDPILSVILHGWLLRANRSA